jgi:DNA repair protein SbcD/Mre11
MADPIRVLHFADSHIGMENYGRTDPETGLSSRVVDFLRRMDEIVEYAREHDVDLTVFAGDAFKTRSPNPTLQREFAHRIRDLSEIAPIVLLVGNHDLPPSALKASSIEIYETLAVPNVWVAYEYAGKVIETKRGPVYVAAAPYPIRARLLERIPTGGMTIAQTDELLQTELSKILDQLAVEADEKGDMPRLLTGHFTVGGAVVGSERGIMLGRDVAVPKNILADPRWDYVALGHIHKHQNLTEGRIDAPPVVYSGSIERIDFGEEGDPKGFCWVELSRDETTWEFVKVRARPFVTLRGDLRESVNPTQDTIKLIESHNLKQAVVRMYLQMTQESEARFNEMAVRHALQNAGVFHFASLRKEIDQPTRARLGASPEGLTAEQLLERYLISKEVSLERRTELMEAASSVFSAGGEG